MKLFWNLYAWVYNTVRYLSPYQEMIEQVTRLASTSSPDSSFLDAGCGSANLLKAVKAAYPERRLAGIDFSESMLAKAQKKVPGVYLRQVDLTERLPFGDNSFATVASINVIYSLPKEKQQFCIDELLRVLQPGGKLIVVVPQKDASTKVVIHEHIRARGIGSFIALLPRLLILSVLFKRIEKGAAQGTYTYYTRKELEQLGFHELATTYADQNWLGVITK